MKNVQISFTTGATLQAVKTEIKEWYREFFGEEISEAGTTNESEIKKSNGRGPGRKKATEVSAPTTEAAAANTAASTQVPDQNTIENFTQESVKAELQKVIDVKDVIAAKALLTKFGANRLSDLRPETYAKFVEDCRTTVAGA